MSNNFTGKEFRGMAGAHAAMFTPFDKKGRLNLEAVDALVEYGVKGGLKGFYLTGSTGEGMLLTLEERKEVYRRAVAAAKGRCKLIAQVGCVRTDDSIELAKAAADAGVDWISSVAPVYFGQNFPSAMRHYKAISEATDLPFLVYAFNSELVPERDARLFDPFGLTKLGDSDKMIKENKASECRPRLSYDTLTRRLENNYEINLAHTGRPAL